MGVGMIDQDEGLFIYVAVIFFIGVFCGAAIGAGLVSNIYEPRLVESREAVADAQITITAAKRAVDACVDALPAFTVAGVD